MTRTWARGSTHRAGTRASSRAMGGWTKPHQQDGEKAPGDGAGEADVAVEVEFLIGVIPVTDLEDPLHGRAGGILQRRGSGHAKKPHQVQVVLHGNDGKQDDDGPGAVDRQQGTVEKAAVYPLALADGDIAGLPDPAAETVEIKEQGPLARSIDMHRFFPQSRSTRKSPRAAAAARRCFSAARASSSREMIWLETKNPWGVKCHRPSWYTA